MTTVLVAPPNRRLPLCVVLRGPAGYSPARISMGRSATVVVNEGRSLMPRVSALIRGRDFTGTGTSAIIQCHFPRLKVGATGIGVSGRRRTGPASTLVKPACCDDHSNPLWNPPAQRGVKVHLPLAPCPQGRTAGHRFSSHFSALHFLQRGLYGPCGPWRSRPRTISCKRRKRRDCCGTTARGLKTRLRKSGTRDRR